MRDPMSIKIPSFKLVYQRDDNNLFGEISPALSIGLALHWAWVYATMFGATHIFLPNTSDGDSTTTYMYIISMLSLALTMGIIGAFYEKTTYPLVRPIAPFVAALISTVSTFALLGSSTTSAFGLFLLIVSGVFTGIGSGTLLVLWGKAYYNNEISTITLNAAGAIVIGVALYALLISQLPFAWGAALTSLLPIAEAALLRVALKEKSPRQHTGSTLELPRFHNLRVRKSRFAFKLGVSSIIFGFALGALRELSVGTVLAAIDPYSHIVLVAGAALAALLLITSVLVVSKYEYGFYYRPFVSFIVIILLLIPSVSSGNEPITSLILLVGYICFEIMMWLAYAEIAHRFRLSALLVFGLGRSFLVLGTFGGTLAGQSIFNTRGLLALGDATGAIIIMGALVIGYCLLPREKDIKVMVIPDGQEDDEPVEKNNRGRFAKSCEKIAATYLLSKRETEILYLLAKGRNAAYIQAELFISEGTVKTHIWRIYKKLGIHTQQDLIDMIDEEIAIEKING